MGSRYVVDQCARCGVELQGVPKRSRFCSAYCRQKVEDIVKTAIDDLSDAKLLELVQRFEVRYRE